MAKPVPNDKRREIADLLEVSKTAAEMREIAAAYNCSVKTLQRIRARSEGNDGNVDLKQKGGDKKSSPHIKGMIETAVEMLDGEDCVTEEDISNAWFEKFEVKRSPLTVRGLLKRHGVIFRADNGRKAAAGKPAKVGKPTGGKSVKKKRLLKNNVRRKMEKRLVQKSFPEGVKLRYRCLLALNDGYRVEDVADILRISSSSIYNWLAKYREGGLEGISHWGYLGMRNNLKLRLGQMELLYEHLVSNPKTTLKKIMIWIQEDLGVSYSLQGVRLLVRSLGFVFRNSKLMPRLPPLKEQKKFMAKFKRIIAKAPEGSILLYGDAFHPTFCGKSGGCWVPRDKIPIISQATGRQRLNVIAFLNTATGKFTFEIADSINREVFIKLLEKTRLEYPDAPVIHVVVDNARYHRAKDVQTWIDNQDEDGPRIKLIFLPPYCPHFNLIERLWKKYHDRVTRNKVQKDFKEFTADSMKFFENVAKDWEEHKSYVDITPRPKDPANYLDVSRTSPIEIAA